MKPKPRKRRRLVYRQHTDDQVRNAIKASIPEGSIVMDWLELQCLERVSGGTEFDRGRAEGKREAFAEIMEMVLTDNEVEVKTNVD